MRDNELLEKLLHGWRYSYNSVIGDYIVGIGECEECVPARRFPQLHTTVSLWQYPDRIVAALRLLYDKAQKHYYDHHYDNPFDKWFERGVYKNVG